MLDRLRARAQRTDEGFTLIELLIVIVILGILAAIVVFAVGNSTNQATTASCQADKKTVETALEAYKANVGSYPTAGDWSALTGTGNNGPFLKEQPKETFTWDGTTGAISGGGC